MEELKDKINYIPLEDIIPNRFQPRLAFDEKELTELSNSIIKYGVIQPIVVRNIGGKYEIIAGERRYKASCLAGLTKIPAIINNTDDNTSAEIALLENIQRKNLTVIEEAQSYKKLIDRGFTQDDIAKKIGVSQSSIANKLRLLNLPKEVQNALLYNQISERHARCLLSLNDEEKQKNILNKIVTEKLTVKQTEDEISKNINNIDNINNMNNKYNIDNFDNNINKKTDIDDLNSFSNITIDNIDSFSNSSSFNNNIISNEENNNSFESNNLENLSINNTLDIIEEKQQEPIPVIEKSHEIPDNIKRFLNLEPVAQEIIEPEEISKPEILDLDSDKLENDNQKIEIKEYIDNNDFVNPFQNTIAPENLLYQTTNEQKDIINNNENTSYEDTKLPNEEYNLNNDKLDIFEIEDIEEENTNYQESSLINEDGSVDLPNVINKIRNFVTSLDEVSDLIETSELDLNDKYQIIIDINKNV